MSDIESDLQRQRRKAAELDIRIDTLETLAVTCLVILTALTLVVGVVSPVAVDARDGSGVRLLLLPLQLMGELQGVGDSGILVTLLLANLLTIATVIAAIVVGVLMIARTAGRSTLVVAKVVGGLLILAAALLLLITVGIAMGEVDHVFAARAAWWYCAGAGLFCASWWHEPLRNLWYRG